jgi:hypothetical protein
LEAYNNYHFDVKLAPEFFNAKLIICITLPDKPAEDFLQNSAIAASPGMSMWDLWWTKWYW